MACFRDYLLLIFTILVILLLIVGIVRVHPNILISASSIFQLLLH